MKAAHTNQLKKIDAARTRLGGYLSATPLTFSAALSELVGHNVYLKWENKFRTGSFKERGALNFLLTRTAKERDRGVCAASAGNHALALSAHAQRLKIPCHIFMPKGAPLVKIQSTAHFGAKIELIGESLHETVVHAKEYCKQQGCLYVSPYDDEEIIYGQGTCALEILEQLPEVDSIISPVGGGGLLSGLLLALKAHRNSIFAVGVQSEWAATASVPHSSLPALRSRSIADGIAVKSLGTVTAPIVSKYADLLLQAGEHEIASQIVHFLDVEHSVIEGAAAAALVALAKNILPDRCRNTVVVITGSNIDMNLLSRLLERSLGERGRLLKIAVSVPDRPGSLHTTTGILAAEGANVLQVHHDRSFAKLPGNVEITFLLEVRDMFHGAQLIQALGENGLPVRSLMAE